MNPQDAKKKANEAYAAASSDAAKTAVQDAPGADVRAHQLSPLGETLSGGESGNIDLLMDISVPVVAQLGATEMRIRDILQLAPGSIVELDKLAGDPVDLYVRGKLFAHGEVVVVDDSFGIRITKIVDPNQRAVTAAD